MLHPANTQQKSKRQSVLHKTQYMSKGEETSSHCLFSLKYNMSTAEKQLFVVFVLFRLCKKRVSGLLNNLYFGVNTSNHLKELQSGRKSNTWHSVKGPLVSALFFSFSLRCPAVVTRGCYVPLHGKF